MNDLYSKYSLSKFDGPSIKHELIRCDNLNEKQSFRINIIYERIKIYDVL
jgi:hypothetical protein